VGAGRKIGLSYTLSVQSLVVACDTYSLRGSSGWGRAFVKNTFAFSHPPVLGFATWAAPFVRGLGNSGELPYWAYVGLCGVASVLFRVLKASEGVSLLVRCGTEPGPKKLSWLQCGILYEA
jgi:hypothetical protein